MVDNFIDRQISLYYYVRHLCTFGSVEMNSISVNKFRENLKNSVEQVIQNHKVLKVTRRSGDDFIVVSADDWEREQETLYVLQNNDLIRQIAESTVSYAKNKGYKPSSEELNEIISL